MRNFAKYALEEGGQIYPIIVPSEMTNGTGIFNPSLFLDSDGKLFLNVRHCQVTLWHSEHLKFQHPLAPIAYINPENDISLRSTNFICKTTDNFDNLEFKKVDMTLDVPPKWEFIGLEDPRVVRWDGKLLLCGGRRDTTTNGQGRLEITEIDESFREINRHRIQPPDESSYCEKNWMPINDMPWHFVKWTHPTEVVRVDLETKKASTVVMKDKIQSFTDFRGGSNVIRISDEHRMAIVHVTYMFKTEAGKKNARYTHFIIVWDNDWNIVRISQEFMFLDTEIEFCCGLEQIDDDLLISFGLQDNAAFVLRVKKKTIGDMICLDI